MKLLQLSAVLIALSLPALARADEAAGHAAAAPAVPDSVARTPLQSDKDRMSYAVGIQTGRALRTADGPEVNLDVLVQGLKEGLANGKIQMGERQMTEVLGRFQQTLRQKSAAMRAHARLDNQKAADDFFAANKDKPGVVALSSGLQYRVIEAGQGATPAETDEVLVDYRGTKLDGTEFDATEQGHPAHLRLSKVIAGWREVLKIMPVGSHWEIYIPPQLGYGERGAGSEIGPNEALVFDLHLLSSQKAVD